MSWSQFLKHLLGLIVFVAFEEIGRRIAEELTIKIVVQMIRKEVEENMRPEEGAEDVIGKLN